MCKRIFGAAMAAVIGLTLAWSQGAPAAEATAALAEFDLPAQALADSLRAVAVETQTSLLFDANGVTGKQAPALKGRVTVDEAVTRLLVGSGLAPRRVDERTIVLAPEGEEAKLPVAAMGIAREEAFRVAQAEGGAAEAGAAKEKTGEQNAAEVAVGESDGAKLEEIVVTAQKRVERLQDVPISISVLSGESLDKSTAQGVTEALNRVPGVAALDRGGATGTQLAVRGVSAAAPTFTGSSTVGYYLDSVPFGFSRMAITPDANAYDLERVEVLRGPQGTLYGASALNGVVRVLTKDANLDAFETKARGSVSSTEDGAASYRADMAINVPLIAGKLAARAVVGYQDLGGWIDKPIRDDVNDSEIRNYRLKVNAQPTEQFSIGLSAWLSRADAGATSGSLDDRTNSTVFEEPGVFDYDAYGLKLGYDFSRVSFTSMTSYLDYFNEFALELTPFGFVDFSRTLNTANNSRVFSEEVTLNSVGGGAWRWSLGGIYRDSDEQLYQDRINTVTGVLVAPYAAPAVASTLSESFAVFGEVTRLFLEGRWELTGGLRYFEDEISDKEHSRRDFVGGIPVSPAPPLVDTVSKFDSVSPRVVLTWHPRDRSSVYASFSEGFRSGLTQLPAVAAIAPEFPPADADTLKNYEIGMKSSIWGGKLALDAAAFYIDWQGVQQQLGVDTGGGNFLSTMLNAGSASGPGFEFSVTAEPIRRLSLGLSYSWNDLTMDEDVSTTVVRVGVPTTFTLFPQGSRLSTSPETTAGVTADYSFPLGQSGFEGRLSASANYISEMDQRILLANVTVRSGDSILISRMNFSVAAPKNWTASVFVDNINDEDGITSKDLFATQWDLHTRPRTVGLQFEYRFN